MKKLILLSRILKIIFSSVFVFLPIYIALFWMTNGQPLGSEHASFAVLGYDGPDLPPISLLPLDYKFLGFLINLIPVAFYMAILWSLTQLFKRYEKLEIFSLSNVKSVRNVGIFMLFNKIIHPLYLLLLSFLLTQVYPTGERFAYTAFTIQDGLIVVMALLIIVISWVMQEGYRLQDEQRYTI